LEHPDGFARLHELPSPEERSRIGLLPGSPREPRHSASWRSPPAPVLFKRCPGAPAFPRDGRRQPSGRSARWHSPARREPGALVRRASTNSCSRSPTQEGLHLFDTARQADCRLTRAPDTRSRRPRPAFGGSRVLACSTERLAEENCCRTAAEVVGDRAGPAHRDRNRRGQHRRPARGARGHMDPPWPAAHPHRHSVRPLRVPCARTVVLWDLRRAGSRSWWARLPASLWRPKVARTSPSRRRRSGWSSPAASHGSRLSPRISSGLFCMPWAR